jgi:hypothetical protein
MVSMAEAVPTGGTGTNGTNEENVARTKADRIEILIFFEEAIKHVNILAAYPSDPVFAIDFLKIFRMMSFASGNRSRRADFFGDDIEFYGRLFDSLVLPVGGPCPPSKTRDKTTANTRVARGLAAFKNAFAPATIAA